MKRKKPNFIIQDYFRYKRLGRRWRKPRGRQSKLRKSKADSGFVPRIGYGADARIKHMKMVDGGYVKFSIVKNLDELNSMEKGGAVFIASGIGTKKLLEFQKKADDMGLVILNKRKMKKISRTEYKIKEIRKKKEEEMKKELKKHEHKEVKKEPESKTEAETKEKKKEHAAKENKEHKKTEHKKEKKTVHAAKKKEAAAKTDNEQKMVVHKDGP
jgi:large subunit ribosomal protein L32e